VFVTSSQPAPSAGSTAGLRLVRAERRSFAGPAEFLADPAGRAHLEGYLADLTRPYALRLDPAVEYGQSYGEMAEALIRATVPAGEPVDLLVVAFAVHDMQPGRATATYLSHVCPGTPLSFAICEQGSAAAFSGLRIAQDYTASAGCRRALLIVAEQAALPYHSTASLPVEHRAVALLFDGRPAGQADNGKHSAAPSWQVGDLRQLTGVGREQVPAAAAGQLAELSAGHHEVRVVLSATLADAWPHRPAELARVVPAGQPDTGLWWQLLDELEQFDAGPGSCDLLVAADYEPELGYLCLVTIEPATEPAIEPAAAESGLTSRWPGRP
jgi:hypothetical protein